MADAWCVADDMVPMPLLTRSETAVLALAEQHREVIVFLADWDEVFYG